jgi:hypothetical protein
LAESADTEGDREDKEDEKEAEEGTGRETEMNQR